MSSTMESVEASRPKLSPTRRLAKLFRPDRADLWSVVVFSLVSGILLLATPVAVQALVDFVAFGATVPSIAILALLLFLALGTAAGVVALQNWIVEILQRRLFVRLVADLAERLPRVSWKIRDKYHLPELVNRFFDTVTIQKVGSQLLLEGLANLLSIMVGASVLAFYHPVLLAFDIVLLALIALVFLVPLRKGAQTAVAESNMKYMIAGWLEEIAAHPLSFKCAGSRNYVTQRSAQVAQQYVEARRNHFRVVYGQIIAALGVQVLASTALLTLGGWLVVIGQLTLGQLVAAELLVVLVVNAVAKLGKLAEKLYDLLAAVEKVGKLLDLETEELEDHGEYDSARARLRGPARLEFRDLVIPGEGSQLRRDPINLVVEPGNIVALTGAHGIGKSALLELLFRLRSPMSGSILMDGSHAEDIPLGAYRENVAFAGEPEIIEGSIAENISLGRPGIGLAEIEDALDAVGLREELQGLTEGLGTKVRPNGAPLSSSQRSRIMLARGLAGKPRLLLVDELLDDLTLPRVEMIRDSFFKNREHCTVVMASDRAKVMEFCDQVLDLGTKPQTSGDEG
jgi:putative ABC transport system ATP-binding protein